MPKVYQFGCAPDARKDGFAHFSHTIQGVLEDIERMYEGQDLALVMGPEMHGQPGVHEFGVLSRTPKRGRTVVQRAGEDGAAFAYVRGFDGPPIELFVAQRATGLQRFAGKRPGAVGDALWVPMLGLMTATRKLGELNSESVTLGFHAGRQRWYVARERSGNGPQPYVEFAPDDLHLAMSSFAGHTRLPPPRVTIAWASTDVRSNKVVHYDAGIRTESAAQPWRVEPGHTYTLKVGRGDEATVHVREADGKVQWAFENDLQNWSPIDTFPRAVDYGMVFKRDGVTVWNAWGDDRGFAAHRSAEQSARQALAQTPTSKDAASIDARPIAQSATAL